MKKKPAVFMAFILCLFLFFSIPAQAAESGYDQVVKLIDVSTLIGTYALDGPENDALVMALSKLLEEDPALFDRLMAAMFEDLDEYSRYLTREEYEKAYPTGISFVGIGVYVDDTRDAGIFVREPMPGSPAEAAGIAAGDQIVRVDGRDVTVFPWQAGSELLRGEEGSSVTLEVRRDGEEKPIKFTVVRKAMLSSNVSYQDLGDGVGYFSIAGFGSFSDFSNFVSTYKKIPYEGVRSVIIDLRNNGGGDVSVMYNMLNNIVQKKGEVLFAAKTRQTVNPQLYVSSGAAQWTPNELIILVNEYTASAAEIFAGSLQDLGLATLVGVKTYGKGRGQYALPLSDGSVVVVTGLDIMLPLSMSYDKKGIVPAYVTPIEERPYPETPLSPMDTGSALLPTARSARVKGLEERLSLLGHFKGIPDGNYDAYTMWAANAFQRQQGLPETAYAGVDTLRALAAETDRLLQSKVPYDTQMELALERAREAARRPLSGTLPPLDAEDSSW